MSEQPPTPVAEPERAQEPPLLEGEVLRWPPDSPGAPWNAIGPDGWEWHYYSKEAGWHRASLNDESVRRLAARCAELERENEKVRALLRSASMWLHEPVTSANYRRGHSWTCVECGGKDAHLAICGAVAEIDAYLATKEPR